MNTYIVVLQERKPRHGHYLRKGVVIADSAEEAKTLVMAKSLFDPRKTTVAEVSTLQPYQVAILL